MTNEKMTNDGMTNGQMVSISARR